VPDLLDDLRRYGAAVEESAVRHAPLADYPVGRLATPARATTRAPRPRWRVLVAAVAASVLVVVVAVVILVRHDDRTGPVVDTPTTVAPVPTAEPFEDGTVLLWLPYDAPPEYLGQKADRPVPLEIGDPPQPGRSLIATTNTYAGFLVQGELFLVDRIGVVTATGVAGDRVVADRAASAMYVLRSGQLIRLRLSEPAGVDGQWTVPTGWQVPNDGSVAEVLDGRVLLERTDLTSANQEIAVWTPATGELRSIGTARWVVDATSYPDGVPKVAWIDTDCDPLSTGCGLVITRLDTMESVTVARPEHGFIGGGAFSDDGRHLAAFVAGQANMPMNPSTDLAVIDTDTFEVRVLSGTNVAVGEPYGSAAWTLDNSSVIFHGLSETRVVDITTGAQRTLPWEIAYGMATIP
jgi:hypothetical protein